MLVTIGDSSVSKGPAVYCSEQEYNAAKPGERYFDGGDG